MPSGKSQLFHNYCEAVERTVDAHPIQRAQELLPPGVFATGADLYDYTVCSYDENGAPLEPDDPATKAGWIIFDNVYIRTRGGRFPQNRILRKAHNAGFWEDGKQTGPYGPERARLLWQKTLEQWGPRGGSAEGRASDRSPAQVLEAVSPRGHTSPAPRVSEAVRPAERAASVSSTGDDAGWAQTLVDGTAGLWRSMEGQYPLWTSGFAVCYSPFSSDAKVVIVGANPGGGASDFDVRRASVVPTEHDYLAYNYPMARKMRELFQMAGRPDLLRTSIKTNLNFFRSVSTNDWQSIPPDVRERMERHSEAAVREVLRRLRPPVVLAEGMASFNRLSELVGASSAEVVVRGSAGRAYVRCASQFGGMIVGIMHPTGARIATETWKQIGAALKKDLTDI